MPTIHLIIKGRVQGVFFRASAKEIALRLNLKGWVKNTQEGHVEAVANGDQDMLDDFVKWCRKGPDNAAVSEVLISTFPDEKFDSFRIKKDSFF